VREYYSRKYGVDMCPNAFGAILGRPGWSSGGGRDGSAAAAGQGQMGETYDADRALAVELQRQLDEEERELDRLAKRNERQMWYGYFLEKSSMVRP
jgi:hypothetical protein